MNYSKNLSRSVAADGIRVNCLAPGNILFDGGSWEQHLKARREEVERYISTEVPQKRFGTPEEIARFAAFLVSPNSKFATGGCYIMDGGQTRRVVMVEHGSMTDAKSSRVATLFDLRDRVAIITGGAGLLGYYHGAILASAGAHVVLLDLPAANPVARAKQLTNECGSESLGIASDITSESSLENARAHDS